MTLTTAQAFDKFWEAVSIDASTTETVNQRRSAVVNVIKQAFPSTSTMRYISDHVIGSMGRKTASRPFDDIDLMVHLKVDDELWSNKYQWNSSDFLYRVRNAVNNASTVQKIGARGQAVRLFYADGLSVDIAAVVKYNSGGYGIPSGTGTWLTTDPLKHGSYMSERNAALGNNLKRLVVFAKQWNKAHSSRLTSFHVELMAARTFSTLGNNRRIALRTFFDYNLHNLSVMDPAGYSGDVPSYLSYSAREAVNNSLAAARDRADLAIAAENQGNHAEAIPHWRIILGSRFPTS